MKSHILRPVLVIVCLLVALVVFRQLYVPASFGVHERGYMYGWYRAANVPYWKNLPVKYKGKPSCQPCHQVQVARINQMPHALIECENCHGPARNHPDDPKKLPLDKSRALCLRCHAKLLYPSSARARLRGIDPKTHNPGFECVRCHLPHQPSLNYLQSATSRNRRGVEYCKTCHPEQAVMLHGMPHAAVQCEECHGPARNHPTDPPKLAVDETRELCLRCHPDRVRHNAGITCITCHDPHRSGLQFARFTPP